MDIEVQPNEWVLPNRVGYNKYIYNTFHSSKYPIKKFTKSCECTNEICEIPTETVSLFPHQRIIRDFIQVQSPYRGILLYHELGAGKSGASIAAAEGYVGKKKVYILSPASLAQNYENELMKISTLGLNMKKTWSLIKINPDDKDAMDILKNNYAINFTFNDGLIWVPMYKNDIPIAEIVVKDKKYTSFQLKDKEMINDTIQHIIKNRYTFISYNGLTQKIVSKLTKNGFDNSFIVIDEIHNFISRVVNGSKLARGLYNSIMNAIDCKLVLLSGTPIINNPYEITSLINLIRGQMNVYEIKLLKNSIIPTNDQIINKMKEDNLYQFIDEISYNNELNKIHLLLLPNGYCRETNDGVNIIAKQWNITEKKFVETVIDALNKIKSLRVGTISTLSQFYALPNSKDEFNQTFLDTRITDDIKIKNTDLFQRRILGTLSYYRVSGSEFFPKVLPNNITYLPMTDHQFNIYADVRAKERAIDNASKRNTDVFADKSSVYRAFSRMVCNFAFPENIKRVFPQDIRKIIMKEYENDKDDDDEDDINIDKKIQKKLKEEYDETLNKAVQELIQDNHLTKENLKKFYSPKYAKMINDIEESPGTVLIYSQFRTMEGLGIFSKALDNQGYKEITIKNTEKGYVFEDLSIFDKKYDDKRYVIFNNDRVKTNILINIFNGSFSLLPDSIKQQIPDEYVQSQLYGKFAKILMITQSGAEGISLKNVRRVLIMEYFWNSVRINQVIGRAVRTCSHETLPKDERNVQIFTYIMKFTKKQMEKDFTLRTLDKEKTTDQHILEIASKKETIINEFLTMLKASSMDCIINSVQNKPLEEGYKCYNWAININNNELSYTPDIKKDGKILTQKRYQVNKNNKGIVVSNNGKKYVMLNKKLYDYFSYKNAGILLPV